MAQARIPKTAADMCARSYDETVEQPSLHLSHTTAPLAVRMRPTVLADVVGQEHLTAAGSPLSTLAHPVEGAHNAPTSVILWGPPGTGKTTLAQVVAASSGRKFVELSAVTAGVKDVRTVMEQALTDRDLFGRATVLFLDEIHRFTKAQQDALLPGVEQGWVTLIAATTENPSFSVVSPLLSRSLLLTLKPLTEASLEQLLSRAVSEPRGLNNSVVVDQEALDALVLLASGDARRALTALEAAASAARVEAPSDGQPRITAEIVSSVVDTALLRYDRDGDQHYDVTSALIKSVRGSDPDAALHYLARMIEAGEDPRFIARRLIILASEDIGLADPQALQIAVAAADAVALIGMPEGRIPLAEATVYLATAPKSNAVYAAIGEALADVKAGRGGQVPPHLRDAHYAGARALGHGTGYVYPHDDVRGVVEQQYLPDSLKGRTYFHPTQRGLERELTDRLQRIRDITRPEV